MPKLGTYIQTLRKKNGLTQAALAARLYVTDKAVSKWERGLSCPVISLFPKLADILGVSVSDLLREEMEGGSGTGLRKAVQRSPDIRTPKYRKSLYIVDGYNVIFAWDELSKTASHDLDTARRDLLGILANYRAFTHREIIVVFDAYNVKGGEEHKEEIDGLHVVFTKEGELADTYIERLIYEIGKDQNVRAVTSDGLIQLQAVRSGVLRLSAREFREELLAVDADIADYLRKLREGRG